MKPFAIILLLMAGACTTWNPPAEYDRPYTGVLHVERIPQAQMQARCAALLAPWGIDATPGQLGCASYSGDECTVYIIDRMHNNTTPQAVLRHELGHCNGWPTDHNGTTPSNRN